MKLISPTGHKKITLQKNEHVEILLEDFKPGSRKFTLEVELVGQNAHCEISGRAQTSKQDTKEWTVTQKFLGKNQTGRIELRGVAEDKSFLRFDASAILEQVSHGADAEIAEKEKQQAIGTSSENDLPEGYPQYIDSGNKVEDDTKYAKAKEEWINKNPDRYRECRRRRPPSAGS